MEESHPQPSVVIIYKSYTPAQRQACHKYYAKNRDVLCEKARLRYHKKKDAQAVHPLPVAEP
jgi:hypothetical protein